jgi:hypothetical protein
MKIAKLSAKGKFLFAMGASHDIPGDRPDRIVKAVVQMRGALEGKSEVRLKEERRPQLMVPTRLFVDSD